MTTPSDIKELFPNQSKALQYVTGLKDQLSTMWIHISFGRTKAAVRVWREIRRDMNADGAKMVKVLIDANSVEEPSMFPDVTLPVRVRKPKKSTSGSPKPQPKPKPKP
jgi:hypothetical protein